jgi:biopolymer transport protein ExbD|nr:biopolymer transporter ExbD [Candidatus Krumholzibacteria bacterium]
MKFRPEKKSRGLIINVTSLIDVMFLLLIFFMVTSTFKNQPAINLVLPRSSTATETVETPVILYLTNAGQVYLNDTLMEPEALARELERLHTSTGDDRMVMSADQDADHGDVVHLIDTIKQSGFTRVSISARKAGNP